VQVILAVVKQAFEKMHSVDPNQSCGASECMKQARQQVKNELLVIQFN